MNKTIERELTNLSGQTFSDHKGYRTYIEKAFQRIWDKGIKEPHNTEEVYCCACEYDIAIFEGKLAQQKEEYQEKFRDLNKRLNKQCEDKARELSLEGEKSMARGVLRRIAKGKSLEHIKVLCEAVIEKL